MQRKGKEKASLLKLLLRKCVCRIMNKQSNECMHTGIHLLKARREYQEVSIPMDLTLHEATGMITLESCESSLV
jgi:hypothetical protein